MNIGILKQISLMVILFVLFSCPTAFGKDKITIGILPFAVHADKALSQLENSLPRMLSEKFQADGAETILIDTVAQEGVLDYGKIKELAIQHGVDHLIWGSLFMAGDRLSVDARMAAAFDTRPPVAFFVEADGVENIFSAVNRLSREISSVIFKREFITGVKLEGNRRIESDAVLRILTVKSGDIFTPAILSDDIKKIYSMGYFDDVRVESHPRDKGVELVFTVVEKPSVRRLKIKGNRVYDEKGITEVTRTSTGSIVNIFKLDADVARIKALYTEKNYHNCAVHYEISPLDNNQADIEFIIDEGNKLRIESILFEGNSYFSDKKLKKIMKTKEKGFFFWLTSSGDLSQNELDQDVFRLESHYKDQGFVDARISDPEIQYEKESISVTFKIEEGIQYRIGKVDFTGDIIVPVETLAGKIKSLTGELYSRKQLRSDVISLTDIYSDKGYANAEISPVIERDSEKTLVNITFNLEKKSPVYFERILISGNTKTRDKVIRRQIKVYEQELYSMSKLQSSVNNLKRIDYFQNVEVSTSRGSREDLLNVHMEITEKPTGAFSFGGGYSSEDSMFGMVSVTERNLFGKGQIVSVKAEISGKSNRYTLSFTEPWLFDIPLSAGFDLYNWDKEYNYYDKESRGGALRLGYMIFDYTSIGLRYRFEDFEISNVQDIYTSVDAGNYITSSLTASLKYDSRNKRFNATEGMVHSLSVEYAGGPLGGEIEFTKYIAESGVHFPLFWKLTGLVHGKTGFLQDRSSDDIEIDYEKFYLGGINSVRGYDWQDIHAGRNSEGKIRGGEKFIQFNAELNFPLLEDVGLAGVVFFDSGDVFASGQEIKFNELKSSYGAGIRWYSPMGPIRIEYGITLDDTEESTAGDSRWEFSMGSSF
ncbi:MAG: outer membrane protein assembly factor BamA [Desulfobacterium sp.]|jgi:outer membrane protein insertion porin family|nr:outer membrane protein assembly factor BamA [Desulfobacterium sp.]